jgi:DNA (cytosine-5)-methyltransferase 1
LLTLQNFPLDYQFPSNYSLRKIASFLGNSVNTQAVKHFLRDKAAFNLSFVDLFSGLGGFHLVLKKFGGKCQLAVDNNKSCAETYQLNFPNTPFLLGDINDKSIQKQILKQNFDLICAGFPCQPFSKANQKGAKESPELTSLIKIIQHKQPRYILLETVPNFLNSPSFNQLAKGLSNYSNH